MAVTLSTATEEAILQYCLDNASPDGKLDAWASRFDAGAGAGYVEFQIAAGTEVATLGLSDPACAASSSSSAVFNSITSDTNATGNALAITKAEFFDSNVASVHTCTVALTGGDITVDDDVVDAGDTVVITSLSLSHA